MSGISRIGLPKPGNRSCVRRAVAGCGLANRAGLRQREKHCLCAPALASFRHATDGKRQNDTTTGRRRMQVLYSGRVQGVGFRYTVRQLLRDLNCPDGAKSADGRGELVAEGDVAELKAFQAAIRDEGLAHFIRDEQVEWDEAQGGWRGFGIAR